MLLITYILKNVPFILQYVYWICTIFGNLDFVHHTYWILKKVCSSTFFALYCNNSGDMSHLWTPNIIVHKFIYSNVYFVCCRPKAGYVVWMNCDHIELRIYAKKLRHYWYCVWVPRACRDSCQSEVWLRQVRAGPSTAEMIYQLLNFLVLHTQPPSF